jgi:transcriptional regulator with GAF, ATPase, and Fis domain
VTSGGSGNGSETATLLRSTSPGQERAFSYALTVIDGPDRGQVLTLDEVDRARALVGVGPVCDLVLTDPEVSRRHASFHVEHGAVRVTDLRSTNGTWVNGVRVLDAILSGGERLGMGGSQLRLDAAGTRMVELPAATQFGRVIGSSPALRRLHPLFERLASSNVPVLIEGETGTGKEVLAESIHECSPRSGGPFIVFDCTSVPPSLLESELFGHERGAFTGAVAVRRGVFEQADGGTLLLDEIGELELSLQPKLLRALERSEVRRIGSDRWLRVDVRVIAATRRDLDREVQEGRFRDDLYFRLAVARVELPPLRERRGDIVALTHHFWRALGAEPAALPYDVLERFERYDWPGNVRELRNAVARQLALGDLDAPVQEAARAVDTLPNAMDRILEQDLPFPRARQLVQAEFERRYIERVLGQHGGSVAQAARASGIARRYFNLILARQRRKASG